jgi:hypothetical protein
LAQLTVRLWLAGLITVTLHPAAQAAALGGVEARSALNQPLRVRIPVTLREGEDLPPNCVRAIAPQRDDLPAIMGARVSVLRDERGVYLQYTTNSPVIEPAVRGAVEVGCTDPVTREFVVLLDPLPVNPPAVAAAPAPVPAPAASAAPPVARPPAVAQAVRPTTTARPPRAVQAPREAAARPTKPAKPAARASTTVAGLSDRLTLAPAGGGVSGLLGGESGLKLSELLSRVPQADAAPPADAEAARKLAIEQARFAAILRDEDPLAAAQAKERELSERLNAMNRDLTAVRAQVSELAQRNRELERFAWFKWIVWGLAGLLGLLALFFGVRAVREFITARKAPKEEPWWTGVQSTIARPPTVYADNPYRDTIKPVAAPAPRQHDIAATTTTFETAPPDSAHKIEVRELERASTTFEREFGKPPETQLEHFSTTIPQPNELQRTAQPTRFAPTTPATELIPPRGPFPDTFSSVPTQPMPPLDFDLNLPALDLDVTPPEQNDDKAADKDGKPSSKPPAKP